jgi:hypothetical protein
VHRLQRYAAWFIAVEALALAYLISISPVSYAQFDARPTLLATQALVERQSFALEGMPGLEEVPGYAIEEVGGHFYYAFPVGTPMLSVPFVALERWADGGAPMDHVRVQKRIAGFLVGALLVLMFALARVFLRPVDAAVLASLAVLGSSLTSTLGTALWSHDFASLITTSVLLVVARAHRERRGHLGVLVGALLWLAFLCRPTLAVMAPCIVWWMAQTSRRAALQATLTAIVGLVCTVLYFEQTRGILLPAYYLPSRLVGTHDNVFRVLYGVLLSPSRGLFVFSPLLALPFFTLPKMLGQSRDAAMTKALLAWSLIHLVTTLRFPHWWGGFSYGPRLMTDIVPPLSALLFLARSTWVSPHWTSHLLVAALGVFSIGANTVQGLFTVATLDWNGLPDVDAHPEEIFNWRYPQFLHTEERAHQRALEAETSLLDAPLPSACGEPWTFASSDVVWIGWYGAESNGRWSAYERADLHFTCSRVGLAGRLHLRGRTEGPQRVRVLLNGVLLVSTLASGAPQDFDATFDPALLHASGWNQLTFETPDARHALGGPDSRTLGFAIEGARVE